MSIAAPPLDVFGCPLDGVSLIEASAGTGKTWNICGLYLRLLLERGLEVRRILVVTFTQAATAELRDRIRQRIVDTREQLRGEPADPPRAAGCEAQGGDPFVTQLLDRLRSTTDLTLQRMLERIELALATFDEAAIFTIHGFCHRALSETPFAAGMPFSTEAVQDDTQLLLDAANDYWRHRISTDEFDPVLAGWLIGNNDRPQKYAQLLKRHLAKSTAIARWPKAIQDAGADAAPDGITLDAIGLAQAAAREVWLQDRGGIRSRVLAALPALNGSRYKESSVDAAVLEWDALLANVGALAAIEARPDKARLFGAAVIARSTNKTPREPGARAPEHPFFELGQTLLDRIDAITPGLALERMRLLRAMLDEASATLRETRRRTRIVTYDDMLFNLHERMHATGGQALAASLRERYPAALVDEFQDTDPLQFEIFDTIYRANEAGNAPLFLVGDPKQAIYGFRNADLHTYFAARNAAAARFTLLENQRSDAPLLRALNTLFEANPSVFLMDGLDYQRVAFGAKPRRAFVDRTVATDSPQAAPLQAWLLPGNAPDETLMHKRSARHAAAGATVAEIARLLDAAGRGDLTLDGEPVRAGDIAVLVARHADGRAMREALAGAGIGSVELSQQSLFHSIDAEDLERLLAAVLEPTRDALLRTALATEVMGMDASAIASLSSDEVALMACVQRFIDYRETWLARGAGTMLRRWLIGEHVTERLLARADGERRMTNLLHLIELLHQAHARHPAPDALMRWFRTQRSEERSDEDAQLRLESDQNLVQIVTIHKSKGLEYPVVFCPFLFDGRRGSGPEISDGVEYHDDAGRNIIDWRKGIDDDYPAAEIADRRRLEQAAESMRLIYVALTRAVHRCVIVGGCYLTGGGKAKATDTESRRSLLNWMVAGADCTPAQWFDHKRTSATIDDAWQRLAGDASPDIALLALPAARSEAARVVPVAQGPLAALAAPVQIGPGWRIGSFTSLAAGARLDALEAGVERAGADHDAGARLPAAADSELADSELADSELADSEQADAGVAAARLPAVNDILHFARGAVAGTCVHAVFERSDFTDPASWPVAIETALSQYPPAPATRSGRNHFDDRPDDERGHGERREPGGERGTDGVRSAQMLSRMLGDVLTTPLPVDTFHPLRLSTVPPARRLNELEFHLPAGRLDANALDSTLARLDYPVSSLNFGRLRGFLKGFIDLVIEHEGRFFIIDWKSNHLGDRPVDYQRGALEAAMREHDYYLQYLLYSVALERHLQHRLRAYDHDTHFGGVIYLFVRGVRPDWVGPDGAPCGHYFDRPSADALCSLSALFGPNAAVSA